MLRDVSFKITDGLLGLRRETGDGVHIKVGVSNAANGSPVAVTGDMDAAQIKERLGLSPLADAAMDAVQAGAGKIWCIGVKPSSKGSVGAVTHEGTGGGTVTVTGEPSNAFDVIVKITGTGGLNAAGYQMRSEHRKAHIHRARGDQHLGHIDFIVLELFADDVHAGKKAFIENLRRLDALVNGSLNHFLDNLGFALLQEIGNFAEHDHGYFSFQLKRFVLCDMMLEMICDEGILVNIVS